MSQINPFAGAIASTPQAQRLASADRDAQLRRTQQQEKTATHNGQPADEFVESADAISPVHDENEHKDPRQKKRKPRHETEPDDPTPDPPHLDIRA
jgi:hypothetical protein